ncbi:uncharacterized protein ACA1_363430 [Acanthamoeba castellanii str. Neff]|uniref:Uncharacterized protein n=1 Tax=Acanthamoeba castellanii (strain ATCC 30010 / Neff) TaxID=1257118 RepID=L8GGG8_ACACF|nr:uncharacterized protein ACA1_363430 [Acanthamoeba castellanii str. Neff]ELR11843.1 hypothetical protein ACA1_363430 [Acanthamoeba castellanii str. Neff]
MEITKSRYLLCLMPQNINLFNALQIIIITPMRLLKHRYDIYFKAKGATRHCYRSMYCILGNHPSQALCTGLAQGGWVCCQYCHNLSAFFHKGEWPIKQHRNYWSVYNTHIATLKASNKGVHGKVGPTNKKIKVHGWGQQRHLLYTSITNELDKVINEEFKAFPPFPGKQRGEMDSFLQITELLFKEWVSNPQECKCWRLHINIVHLLQQETYNAINLNNLKMMTKRWKYLMVKIYSGIAKQRQATQSKRSQTGAASNTTTSGKKLLSFKFPNFKVTQHWSELIHFLGPPWVQDTRLWEQRHLTAKMTAHRTNQINTELTILVKTHQKDAVIRHLAYAGLSPVSSVQGSWKEPYTLSVCGEMTSIMRDRKWNLFDAVKRELGEGVKIADELTSHKLAHYYGHFLQPGDGIALCVPEEYPNIHFIVNNSRHTILNKSKTQRVMIRRISQLLRITCDNKVRPWVELELGDLRGVSDGFLEFGLSQRRFYLPFGWNGWTVAKRVHLVPYKAGGQHQASMTEQRRGARPAAHSTTKRDQRQGGHEVDTRWTQGGQEVDSEDGTFRLFQYNHLTN